jgi:CubicO group peptidase (beta-lactamase class C family)
MLCVEVLIRGAQADFRGAAQVLGRGVQAIARGAARFASQVLDRGAQELSRAVARCASQVLNRGNQVFPAAPLVLRRRYLINAPGCCPWRRSLCVAGT